MWDTGTILKFASTVVICNCMGNRPDWGEGKDIRVGTWGLRNSSDRARHAGVTKRPSDSRIKELQFTLGAYGSISSWNLGHVVLWLSNQ